MGIVEILSILSLMLLPFILVGYLYLKDKRIAKDLDLYFFEFCFFDKNFNKISDEKVYEIHKEYLENKEKEEKKIFDEEQRQRLISKF